jgi:two-component system sensor histidine kinase DegS
MVTGGGGPATNEPVGPSPASAPDRRLSRRVRSALYALGELYRFREFWVLQTIVVLIALGHAFAEKTNALGSYGPTYLFSVTLFILPLVSAALSFGLAGVLGTSVLTVAVMVPDLLFLTPNDEWLGETWGLAIVIVLGVVIGNRVDRERRARLDARQREDAERASEQRYRSLFEQAGEAIVVVDRGSTIVEANAAAGALLKEPAGRLRGRPVESVLGHAIAEMIAGRRPPGVEALAGDRGPIWIEPLVTTNAQPGPGRDAQVIVRDVTLLHDRQRGLEAFARQILAAREEERGRIARDLHDGPVQSLVVLRRKLEALALPTTDDDGEGIADAVGLVVQVAAELRQTSRNLRPEILDDLGLIAALRSEREAFAARTGIKVRFQTNGTPSRLGAPVELMLLRVAQEALRNVERHAEAPAVTISVAFRPTMVRLAILDDGKARRRVPPPADLLAEGKLGVIGMVERARLVGALCRVRTRRGGGLMVEVLVPTGLPNDFPAEFDEQPEADESATDEPDEGGRD